MKRALLVSFILPLVLLACGGDDIKDIPNNPSSNDAPAPTTARPQATNTPGPAVLKSTRETSGPTAITQGNVELTVKRFAVADYKEFYDAQDANGKRTLDGIKNTQGAITVGQIEVKVANKNADKVSVYPDQGTVVIGSEQVDVEIFYSDDVGGEYFAGVEKEGRILFFLKRTPVSQITSALYAVDKPFSSSSVRSLGSDFEFKLTVAPKNP